MSRNRPRSGSARRGPHQGPFGIGSGDSIKAFRPAIPNTVGPDLSDFLNVIADNHNASSNVRMDQLPDYAVSLLSVREARMIIKASPLFGVVGLGRMIRELRLSVEPSAELGLEVEVTGVNLLADNTKISLRLESEQLLKERETLIRALGGFMRAETDPIKIGEPHLTIANLRPGYHRTALELADQVEQIAPRSIELGPLTFGQYRPSH